MADYKLKIHGWNGGECPVHPLSLVDTWLRGGGCGNRIAAGVTYWGHTGKAWDIIAYRTVEPYAELKTFWVNEYKGICIGYESEQMAQQMGISPHRNLPIRIAVKYQEVK